MNAASGFTCFARSTSPPAVLCERLAAGRRVGESFADAWVPAVMAALAAVEDEEDIGAWEAALEGTVGAWQSAYDRQPATRRERRLAALGEEAGLGVPAAGGRMCEQCGVPVSPGARAGAKFCSARCRSAAAYARARGAARTLDGVA